MALRLAHRLRLQWWRATKKVVRGCNVIAANPQGEILLVRHSYHARDIWMLPGGGLGKSEDAAQAAARELLEETHCALIRPVRLGTVVLDRNGWTNAIELIAGTTAHQPFADAREIEEVRFFPTDALPERTSEAARAMIARWLDHQKGSSA